MATAPASVAIPTKLVLPFINPTFRSIGDEEGKWAISSWTSDRTIIFLYGPPSCPVTHRVERAALVRDDKQKCIMLFDTIVNGCGDMGAGTETLLHMLTNNALLTQAEQEEFHGK